MFDTFIPLFDPLKKPLRGILWVLETQWLAFKLIKKLQYVPNHAVWAIYNVFFQEKSIFPLFGVFFLQKSRYLKKL